MILDDGERRRLQRIERRLVQEDPALAEALQRWHLPAVRPHRRWRARALLGAGIVFAVLALLRTDVALALLAAVTLLYGWRRRKAVTRTVPKARREPSRFELGPGFGWPPHW